MNVEAVANKEFEAIEESYMMDRRLLKHLAAILIFL